MGTGWRRAFCTTAPRDRESTISDENQSKSQSQSPSPSPRCCAKMGFLSNSSTPSLRCRTTIAEAIQKPDDLVSPKLQCKTSTPKSAKSAIKSPRTLLGSNPSSPRSPFSILKNSLRLSRVSTFSSFLEKIMHILYMYTYTFLFCVSDSFRKVSFRLFPSLVLSRDEQNYCNLLLQQIWQHFPPR